MKTSILCFLGNPGCSLLRIMLPSWAEVSEMWQGRWMRPGFGTLTQKLKKERLVSHHSRFKTLSTESVGFPMRCFEWEVMSLFFVQLKVGGEN